MTCQAGGEVRAIAQNHALRQRCSSALAIRLLRPGSCCKTSSTETTECDNCIISFMFCLQQLACICSLVACIVGNQELSEASQMISCISDMVYWTVCSCMQTQHKVEMDKRDGKFGPQYTMAVPPTQQMSRIDQPVRPHVGYPPQPAYYR